MEDHAAHAVDGPPTRAKRRERARLVELPVAARRSKRLEALLFSPGLDTLLLAHQLRMQLETARARILALETELRALVQSTGHVVFAATPGGYQLREASGPTPTVGDAVPGGSVVKVGPSPLPGDRRRCAFVELA